MRIERVRWWATAGVLGLFAAWIAACGDTSGLEASSTTILQRSATPPFELSTVGAGGGHGADLVLVQAESNRAAVRFADGTWSEIPGIDETGSWLYRSIGSTVVAGGYRCETPSADGSCADGDPSFFMLADDLSGWRELEAPAGTDALSGEIELTALPATSDWAMFSVGASSYVVDADGTVRRFAPGGGLCAVDGTLVRTVAMPTPADESGADPAAIYGLVSSRIGGFELISLAEPSTEPITVSIADPISAAAWEICGAGTVSIVENDGGTAEWVLDVAERAVTRIESNSNQAGVPGGLQIDGRHAASPNGSTVYVSYGAGNRTWQRTGLEPWQDTGLELASVWATDTAVLGLESTDNKVVELPAR